MVLHKKMVTEVCLLWYFGWKVGLKISSLLVLGHQITGVRCRLDGDDGTFYRFKL